MIVAGPDFRPPPTFGTLQLVFILLALDALIRIETTYNDRALITLTSWYRDPMRNAQVGGLPGSLHPMGLALDFTVKEEITFGNVASGIACGVGSLFGLCKERPVFEFTNAWRRIAPPFTQALTEANGSFHWELDLA